MDTVQRLMLAVSEPLFIYIFVLLLRNLFVFISSVCSSIREIIWNLFFIFVNA